MTGKEKKTTRSEEKMKEILEKRKKEKSNKKGDKKTKPVGALKKEEEIPTSYAEQLEKDYPYKPAKEMYKENKKKEGGRPSKKEADVVAKLEEAFQLDATVEGACIYAGIHTTTFYRWFKNDEGFATKMRQSQAYKYYIAQRTVLGAIKQGDASIALRVLEKRDKRYRDKVDV